MFEHIDFQLFKHNQKFILLPDCYFGDSGFNFWKQGGVLEGILPGKQASGWGRGWRAEDSLWGPRLAAAWARVQGARASCWALWAARATSPACADFLLFKHTFWKRWIHTDSEGLDVSPCFLAGGSSGCNGNRT